MQRSQDAKERTLMLVKSDSAGVVAICARMVLGGVSSVPRLYDEPKIKNHLCICLVFVDRYNINGL